MVTRTIAAVLCLGTPCMSQCPPPTPPPARYFVDSDPDIDNVSQPIGRDGSNWDHAFARLEDALAIAQHGDVVWVANGTYTHLTGSFELPEGVRFYGGFEGFSGGGTGNTLRDPCPQLDWFPPEDRKTVLVPGSAVPTMVVIDSATTTDLTLLDGCWFEGNAISANGGALFASGANLDALIISHCRFAENTAGSGAAVFVDAAGATLTVANSEFMHNEATAMTGEGGAIYANVGEASAVLKGCNFQQNTALGDGGRGGSCWLSAQDIEIVGCRFGASLGDGGDASLEGGAIWAEATSSIVLRDGLISGGRLHGPTPRGGGAFLRVPGPFGSIHVLNVVFVKNAAPRGEGGGLFAEANEILLASRIGGLCGIFDNHLEAQFGGAVYLTAPSNASDPRAVIASYEMEWSEADEHGGAVFTDINTVTIMNSTFWLSQANSGDGGAVYATGTGSLEVVNCNFRRNSAGGISDDGQGGAIFAPNRSVAVSNSIIWEDNTGYSNGQPDNVWVIPISATVAHSLIATDPLFTADDCGGWALDASSPCIDAGSNALLPADLADLDGDGNTAEVVPLDLAACCCSTGQRLRIYDGDGDTTETVDIGAREFRSESFILCEWDGVPDVDVFDLLAFLDDWFAIHCNADLDRNGVVDVFDQLMFLDCWFTETGS